MQKKTMFWSKICRRIGNIDKLVKWPNELTIQMITRKRKKMIPWFVTFYEQLAIILYFCAGQSNFVLWTDPVSFCSQMKFCNSIHVMFIALYFTQSPTVGDRIPPSWHSFLFMSSSTFSWFSLIPVLIFSYEL